MASCKESDQKQLMIEQCEYNIYIKLVIQKIYQHYQTVMPKQFQRAQPQPSPSLSSRLDEFLPMIEHLTLTQKTQSCKDQDKQFRLGNHKTIKKLTRKYKAQKPKAHKSKVLILQKKIAELKSQNDQLTRKIQNCPACQRSLMRQTPSPSFPTDFPTDFSHQPNPCESQMRRIANQSCCLQKNPGGSMEFENIDFTMKGAYSKDQFAWIYLGTLMIAMGSCCTDFDGNLNVFKVKKQSVDGLRRQVEKSEQKINMDFFMAKESLPENSATFGDIGFDPFISKGQPSQGLVLDTIKVESVEQFQLFYDNKVNFKLQYQALIAAMQYIRQNCWISMG